jgi:hypothetical protein
MRGRVLTVPVTSDFTEAAGAGVTPTASTWARTHTANNHPICLVRFVVTDSMSFLLVPLFYTLHVQEPDMIAFHDAMVSLSTNHDIHH